jgi:predicted metalloprotease
MRWRTGRRSINIEDRRGVRLSRKAKGGGIGVLLIALVAMYFGIDPSFILQLSVRLELQADCLAGVWAQHADRARQILEKGDIAEALNAASMIGDDRLQKQARGYVTPDSFTHGSSDQRVRWFRIGLQTGTLGACDTFGADTL